MSKCEFCNSEFDSKNGKLRFCSRSCRAKYAASKVKNHKCNFVPYTKTLAKKDGWKCIWCNSIFRTRKELFNHTKEVHTRYDENGKRLPWNKGLNKENCESISKAANEVSARYKNGEIKVWCRGKQLSKEIRNKISIGMKKAHADGRAHHIGQSRWNNEPSWPEKWFMNVIANEFNDKNYIREYPFGRFSLDFAWPEKLKCIEIDGEQHQRFEEIKTRDKAKDTLLHENNWQVLRLPWKEVFHNTQEYISLAKNFIDND